MEGRPLWLTDTKVRSAKPEEKEYSLVDGDGMFHFVKPAVQSIGDFVSVLAVNNIWWRSAFTRMFCWRMRGRKAEEARKLVAAGIDPRKKHKRAVKEEQQKRLLLSRRLPESGATNQNGRKIILINSKRAGGQYL